VRFDQIAISGADCERRATLALTTEGYTAASPAPGVFYGTKALHSAYIVCKQGPGETQWATVFVASNSTDGNVPGRESQSLERRMTGAAPTGAATTANGCSGASILGEWNWIGSIRITFKADGTVSDTEGGRGTWKATGGKGYQVQWLTYGQQTVNFTLSNDGKSTAGGYQLTRKCS
jgi:hypothetical protein